MYITIYTSILSYTLIVSGLNNFINYINLLNEFLCLQWDLVCDRKQLANVAQTVLMFGVLVGNVVFGMLSDRHGSPWWLVENGDIRTVSHSVQVLPESPRWLLAVGRDEEAIKILEDAARYNKLDTSTIAQKVESVSIHKDSSNCQACPSAFTSWEGLAAGPRSFLHKCWPQFLAFSSWRFLKISYHICMIPIEKKINFLQRRKYNFLMQQRLHIAKLKLIIM
ncbi:hypothetical protein C0J52_04085 [Blattella germanica]|nr:hypothetical protein C0J52_04085 [Blattella germanica]